MTVTDEVKSIFFSKRKRRRNTKEGDAKVLDIASRNSDTAEGVDHSLVKSSQGDKDEGSATTTTESTLATPAKTIPRIKTAKRSPYFPRQPLESCLPFPPIVSTTFGLIQEQLANDPFRLLIATIFLNRTRGGVALPVLFQTFEKFPTVEAMAAAEMVELVSIIQRLGFQNQRARKCIDLARTWLADPPARGKRYGKPDYPRKRDGRDIPEGEYIGDEDDNEDEKRVGWEIAQLPGIGAYGLDSWRIFCRDKLRQLEQKQEAEPEWKRVIPCDKELRAYIAWMWLKEGWVWDQHSGERKRADEDTMQTARRGGIVRKDVVNGSGNWILEPS